MVTAKDLPPGGVGEIKATFRSKGYNGSVRKSFTVESNDPERSREKLTLTGTVVAEVTVTPRYLNFGNVSRDKPAKPVEMEVRLRDEKGLAIKDVRVEGDTVTLTPQGEKNGVHTYAVRLADKLPIGRVTGKILVETTSRKSPEVKVPFYAFVQGKVKVTPQLVSFGLIRPGQPSIRRINLISQDDDAFSVERVQASSDSLSTEIVTEKEGRHYEVVVTYDPGGKKKGRVSERLTIFLKNGDQEEEVVEVPVYGTIHAQRTADRPAG